MTMSAEGQHADQVHLIADWAQHASSHDLEQLLSLFTDDAVYEDVAAGMVSHGKTYLAVQGRDSTLQVKTADKLKMGTP